MVFLPVAVSTAKGRRLPLRDHPRILDIFARKRECRVRIIPPLFHRLRDDYVLIA